MKKTKLNIKKTTLWAADKLEERIAPVIAVGEPTYTCTYLWEPGRSA